MKNFKNMQALKNFEALSLNFTKFFKISDFPILLATLVFFSLRILLTRGTTYDFSPVYSFMQYVDPELIESNLVDALFNNRNYPPGPSALYWFLIQFGIQSGFIARIIATGLSFLVFISIYRLFRSLKIPATINLGSLSILWLANVDVIIMENTFHYSFFSTCFFLLSIISLVKFLTDRLTSQLVNAVFYLSCFSLFRGTIPPIIMISLTTFVIYQILKSRKMNSAGTSKKAVCVLLLTLTINSGIFVNYTFRLHQLSTSQMASPMIYQLMTSQSPADSLLIYAKENGYPSYLSKSSPFVPFSRLEELGVIAPELTGSALRDTKIRKTGQPNWSYEGYGDVFSQAAKLGVGYAFDHPREYWNGVRWQFNLISLSMSCQVGFRSQIKNYDEWFRQRILLERSLIKDCQSGIYTGRQQLVNYLINLFLLLYLPANLTLLMLWRLSGAREKNKTSQVLLRFKYFITNPTSRKQVIAFFITSNAAFLLFFVTTFVAFGEQARYKFEYLQLVALSLVLFAYIFRNFMKMNSSN